MQQIKSDKKEYEQCKLIVDTAYLLLAQVKCFLDKNILETTNQITPYLSMVSLKNTLKLGVRILKSQATMKNIKLQFLGLKNQDSLVMMDALRMQ
jgi:hypothetical protein